MRHIKVSVFCMLMGRPLFTKLGPHFNLRKVCGKSYSSKMSKNPWCSSNLLQFWWCLHRYHSWPYLISFKKTISQPAAKSIRIITNLTAKTQPSPLRSQGIKPNQFPQYKHRTKLMPLPPKSEPNINMIQIINRYTSLLTATESSQDPKTI